MSTPTFEATECPICHTFQNAKEIYAANFDMNAFNEQIFSARRLPDRIHYRIVRCNHCGLLRSDPMADTETITALYQQSKMSYEDELSSLQKTYGQYLGRLDRYQSQKGHLLEIGCANGFFLIEALRLGYSAVTGVEPGAPMVDQAVPAVRQNIVTDVMRPGLFKPDSFDVICMFQVFDHLPAPVDILKECRHVLRENGMILLFNHNEQALSAKVLGEHSPIIDIEHTYLYNLKTMRRILEDNGFQILELGASHNFYRFQYLVRLLPLPKQARQILVGLSNRIGLGSVELKVSLGNLYAIATIREASSS